MAHSKTKECCETVATPNFPAYSVAAISGRHVIVGGGGGAARTGVKNKFDVYELYHNGKQTTAERVVSHDVGAACISNLIGWCEVSQKSKESLSPVMHLAIGQEEKCVFLQLTPKLDSALPVDDIPLDDTVIEETVAEDISPNDYVQAGARHRIQEINRPEDKKFREMIAKKRKQERIRRESINCTLRGEQYFTFDIEEIGSVETVFCRNNGKNGNFEDIYQKVVRISLDNKVLATGGTDGYIRFWSLPELKKVREIAAHDKEVDDLDFRPDGRQIASVCKPTRECCVWNFKDGKKVLHLSLQTNGIKYKFYRARYGTINRNLADSRLFTISNAVVGSKNPGIVAKWETKSYVQERNQELKGTLSSLALSDDGRYLATGTMDGTVYILIAFSLQLLQQTEDAHGTFVTGLEWLPTDSRESKLVRGFSDASVLSISCDNTLKIHHIPRQQMVPVWIVAIIAILVLFAAFSFASFVGL